MSVPPSALPGAQSASLGNNSNGSTTMANGLSESSFLTLLSAELQYQNPLQPMDNTNFIAQLAQFSTLAATNSEESTLQSILGAVQGQNPLVAAAQLIGKTVTTTAGQGQVTAVTSNAQGIQLDVSGLGTVDIQSITGVAS
ncbi:MAG: flagellar hook capping protein [Sulfobacillus benefaciens]|uniref:Flagellar hook capping protein n=1 Tax=Sulfobacillus benefaciens TaxID=453960 RepID=A0A2T2XGN8_9FIRM|nr:MAG: flagellar hook capping protein [Sulfobacillus benefaciens]